MRKRTGGILMDDMEIETKIKFLIFGRFPFSLPKLDILFGFAVWN